MRVFNVGPGMGEPFEIGAFLSAAMAFPLEAEDEMRMKAADALCAQNVRVTYEAYPETASELKATYPRYAEIDIKEERRRLRTLKKRLDNRMIASRMSLGFFEEGLTKRPARLPPCMRRHSLNELTNLVLDQSGESDPENVEKRTWRRSLPVISLATAYQVVMRYSDAGGIPFSSDLQDLGTHRRVVKVAEIHEQVVLSDRRFGIAPDKLIRFRWVE